MACVICESSSDIRRSRKQKQYACLKNAHCAQHPTVYSSILLVSYHDIDCFVENKKGAGMLYHHKKHWWYLTGTGKQSYM